MLANTSIFLVILAFCISAIVIWIAGIKLTIALDTMSKHFNFGEAVGGMIFLAIVTNLPEIAITGIAAYNGHIEIAISNILGGIAIQTVVLAVIDVFGVGKKSTLSFKASSIGLILEGVILCFILSLVIMGKQFKPSLTFFGASPVEWLIPCAWLFGIYIIYKNPSVKHISVIKTQAIKELKLKQNDEQRKTTKNNALNAIVIFIVCAILTLLAGLILEISSEELAGRFQISSVLFGATILAAVTALPEITTGIESAKLKDYQMAVSDIIGGNAFLPVLLLFGSLIGGKSMIQNIDTLDIYLTSLGIILTSIFMIGLIIKSQKQWVIIGYDSLLVVVFYLIGIIGLIYIK